MYEENNYFAVYLNEFVFIKVEIRVRGGGGEHETPVNI
jgi:hypothetical protein